MSQELDPQELESFLSRQTETNRKLCTLLRKAALESMPGTIEIIAHGALGYTTSGSASSRIVYIAPQKSWVNLGFFFGADINDPENLLTGEGKRMRHIKIKNEVDAKRPSIKEIITQAWQKAGADIASISRKKIE